ncbi:hypothetical protein [Bremerella cremea]|uniref:WD40 repeat domain-containing protein n=1 Tax=Bremerella cremea TaxID=1031537 RepID=UPI0031EBB504
MTSFAILPQPRSVRAWGIGALLVNMLLLLGCETKEPVPESPPEQPKTEESAKVAPSPKAEKPIDTPTVEKPKEEDDFEIQLEYDKPSLQLLPPLTAEGTASPDPAQWWWKYETLLEHVRKEGVHPASEQIVEADSSRSAQLLVAAMKLGAGTLEEEPQLLWRTIYAHTRSVNDPQINAMLAPARDQQTFVPMFLPPNQVGGNLLQRFAFDKSLDRLAGVAISPDGTALAAIDSNNGRVKMFELSTGKLLWEGERMHLGSLAGVAFSPDGKWLVSAGNFRKSVVLWDTSSGEVLKSLPVVKRGGPQSVAFSPDGKTVLIGKDRAGADDEEPVFLWDVETGEKRSIKIDGNNARVVAFSPDGKWLATNATSEKLPFIDVASGEVAQEVGPLPRGVEVFALFADGKRVAIAAGWHDPEVEIRDIATSKVVQSFKVDGFRVVSLAVSPDGKYIAVGNDKGSAQVWDVETEQFAPLQITHTGSIACLAFSQDSHLLVSGGGDGMIAVWDLYAKEVTQPQQWQNNRIVTTAISSDGKLMATGGGNADAIIWDAATGQQKDVIHEPFPAETIDRVLFSPDGKQMVFTFGQPQVVLVKLPEALREGKLDGPSVQGNFGPSGLSMVAYSPDGKTIALGGMEEVSIWKMPEEDKVHSFKDVKEGAFVDQVAFSPDSSLVACTSVSEDKIRIYEVASGKLKQTVEVPHLVGPQFFLADGKSLVAANVSEVYLKQDLQIIDIESGSVIRSMQIRSTYLRDMALCDEGKTLVALEGDGWLEFFDLESGKRLAVAKVDAEVWRLASSADGKIVPAGHRGYVQLYQWKRPEAN